MILTFPVISFYLINTEVVFKVNYKVAEVEGAKNVIGCLLCSSFSWSA